MLKAPRNSTLFFAALAMLGVAIGCSSSADSSGGSASTTTAGAAATGTPPTPPAGGGTTGSSTTAAASGPADGAALFAKSCSGCHGEKGANGKAPMLAGKHLAVADITTIVTNGKGRRMPPFGSRLSKDEIDAVAKYVATL